MRKPPSPSQILAYPVSGGLGLIAAAVTGLIALGRLSINRFEVAPIAFEREPWRLFLSIFPHIGIFHLLFNVYWLWVFGTLLEEVYGHVKTAALVLLFAVGSMMAEYALFIGGVGLSGVGYGFVGLLWVLSRRDRRFFDAVDTRTVNVFVVWFFICIALTISKVQPVANVAHGVGALLGVLVGVALAEKRAARRGLAVLGVVAVFAGSFAGATRLRPRVNLSSSAGQQSAADAYRALEEGRNEEAARLYQEAVKLSHDNEAYWFNLGVARERLGQYEASLVAFKRALELEPMSPNCREAVLGVTRQAAYQAQTSQRWDEAIRLYHEAIVIAPDDGISWFNLSVALAAAGRTDEAEQARSHAKLLPERVNKPPR
jgi:membrane associated rhomboid family serine protease